MSTFKYNRLDKNNAAVLLVDHQTGLFSLVRDIGCLLYTSPSPRDTR